MTVPVPKGIDWDVWRVLSSPRINVSLVELETQWSLDDLLDANLVLDTFEELDRRTAPKGK